MALHGEEARVSGDQGVSRAERDSPKSKKRPHTDSDFGAHPTLFRRRSYLNRELNCALNPTREATVGISPFLFWNSW